jgi:predicted nuclease of predicted toxin-antitoxin system
MNEVQYLIDANLPYRFSVWNSADYIHQFDIQFDASDESIWEYAKKKQPHYCYQRC